MKKLILPFSLLFLLLANVNCLKNSAECTPKTPASESAEIQAYASANSILAVPHPSGLYYEIVNAGTGPSAGASSRVVITYTGKLLNGTIFDQRTQPNNTQPSGPESPWALSQLIEGWKVGIPLVKRGGRIQLIIPSAMAYGCKGYGSIPANAILFFDITVVDVIN